MMNGRAAGCARRERPLPPAGGFTLIEMAVAVFVIALLLGSILIPLTTQVEQRKIADTERILAETRDAIIGFAVVNGRLPRPAVSWSNGTERAVCGSEANCTGFIPWSTLGTAKLDGWGKIIRYSVTPAFADATFTLTTAGTKVIQTRLPPGYALSNMVTGVPAVLMSHGANNFGTADGGSVFVDSSATNADEGANAVATGVAPLVFIHRTMGATTTATGGEFDDIVTWVPLTILMNRMVAAGKLP